ncbi:MAG: hypothetical protein OXM61_10705 [Candidatus Poribacteria bacterium]|nr:hypothetical protein [Candidatus Poribacteria bacterium]
MTNIGERIDNHFGENIKDKFINVENLQFIRPEYQNLYDLPYIDRDVSDQFDYPEEDELAIVIRIWENHFESNLAARHLYAKSGIYAALSYIQWTDAVSEGVHVYFIMDEDASEIPMSYLRCANIPKKNILYQKMKRHEYGQKNFLTKHESLLHKKLAKKKRLITVNAQLLHWENSTTQGKVWGPLIEEWKNPILNHENISNGAFELEKEKYTLEGRYDEFIKSMSNLFLESPEKTRKNMSADDVFFSTGGQFYGFSREALNDKIYTNTLKKANEKDTLFVTDEAFIGAYNYLKGYDDRHIYRPAHINIEISYERDYTDFTYIRVEAPDYIVDIEKYAKWRGRFLSEFTKLWR